MTLIQSDVARAVWTSDENTMAHDTARTRWSRTVQNMVDDFEQSLFEVADVDRKAEGSRISKRLDALQQAIEHNEAIRPLDDDGGPDIEAYNSELMLLGDVSWCKAPWLYAECHIYRYVQTLFGGSIYWRGHDIFKRQKDWTFANSRAAVEELAGRFNTIVSDAPTNLGEKRLLFEEMTQIALWGNATDLSLLSKLSLEDIQGLQGSEAIKKNQRNIVSNDMEAVWEYVSRAPSGNRRIDIVLDNSGFEFFTDLVYASYLLRAGLTDSVVLHTKDFPWFVSDVTPQDVESTLSQLESTSIFPKRQHLDSLLRALRQDFASGAIKTQSHPFWTTAHAFDLIPTRGPDLAETLRSSSLIVFKGDLNYRKLVGDRLWPHTTKFIDALGSLGKGTGFKVLALRTNKADTCVGLLDEEQVRKLEAEAPGAAWIRNGKYAVISFSLGD